MPASTPAPNHGSSLRRALLGILAGGIVSAILLGLTEGALRLADYGYDPDFFVPVPGRPEIVTANPRFGFRFFPPSIARVPVECELPVAKPPGTVRIFVLGGSAAMGMPDEAYGFGRILQVMLEDVYPEKRFEVINAAMTAVNSHVVLEVARACAQYDPDLFILYAGNNEVVGPFGAGTVFGRFSPSLRTLRWGIAARRTRIGQLLHRTLADGGPTRWDGMRMFLQNRLAARDPRLEDVYDHFRQNLADIAGLEVPLVLCTVAVNLADSPPFASVHGGEHTDSVLTAWERSFESGVAALSEGACERAADHFGEALVHDDGFAEAYYRLGQCFLALGRFEEAASAFARARDLDALRFRADSRINEVIRETADRFASDNVAIADCESAVAAASPDSIPGASLFEDHVHYTFEGNYLVAATVLEALRPVMADDGGAERPVPSVSTCESRLVRTAWDRFRTAEEIADMMSSAPFTYQAGSEARRSARESVLDGLERQLTLPAMEACVDQYAAAVTQEPVDLRIAVNYVRLLNELGRLKPAAELLEKLLARLPNAALWWEMLAETRAAQGHYAEAVDSYRELLHLMPAWSASRTQAGIALSRSGRFPEAIGEFDRVLSANQLLPDVEFERAMALGEDGQFEAAATAYRRVLDKRPNMAVAHRNLARVLTRLGRDEEARNQLIEADRLSVPSN